MLLSLWNSIKQYLIANRKNIFYILFILCTVIAITDDVLAQSAAEKLAAEEKDSADFIAALNGFLAVVSTLISALT